MFFSTLYLYCNSDYIISYNSFIYVYAVALYMLYLYSILYGIFSIRRDSQYIYLFTLVICVTLHLLLLLKLPIITVITLIGI